MRFDLESKQVLITGGTGGIGTAIALAFADEGAKVLVTGRTQDEVAAFTEQTRHENIAAIAANIVESHEVSRVVHSLDRLDILVNAAGIILRDRREHQIDEFQRVVDVNLTGTMRVSAACHSRLSSSRGCVINVASMLSFFGSGYCPAYSASKGGIVQLTKSLAIAWATDHVRVNAIAPGWIETELTRPLVEDLQRSESIVARTPLGRWGKPADVTGAVLFLCSPAASFITGIVLPVDGGYSAA